MNPEIKIDNLLSAFWHDFDHPDVWWQVGVLAVCLVVAKVAERFVRGHPLPQHGDAIAWRLGQGGLKRIAFPVVALLLVIVARMLLRDWHPVNLLSIAIPLLFSLAVIRAVLYVLRYSLNPSGWVASFERTFVLLIWSVVALHVAGLLPQLIDLLESVGFSVGKQKLNLWLVAQGLFTVVITLLIALWLSGLIDSRLSKATEIDSNLRAVFSRLSKALLIVLAVMVGLPLVGIDLTTLSVFGGALGVGLGFGMQKIASNYVAGFILLLDRSIRLGNVISVSGQRGKVMQITTRYTVLRNPDGTDTIVPNEMIIGTMVNNEPNTGTRMKIVVRARVGYGSDIEAAIRLMEEAARAQREVLETPAPVARIVDLVENVFLVEVTCWIVEPEQGGWQQSRSDISVAIWKAFKSAGLELR